MVGHIGRWETFVSLGVGTELLAVAGLLIFFKRRGSRVVQLCATSSSVLCDHDEHPGQARALVK